MSHFSVAVITKKEPTNDVLLAALEPYEEFECTGRETRFIQEVDQTDEMLRDYERHTSPKLRDADGILHDPYEDRFYRDPSAEELEKHKPMIGTGGGGGISWTSKDWGDGKGHRAKVRFIPDGMTEVRLPDRETKTFAEFIEDLSGKKVVPFGKKPDIKGKHKYGYVLTDKDGNVTKVIDRTNPKRWKCAHAKRIQVERAQRDEALSPMRHGFAGGELLQGGFNQAEPGRSVHVLQSMHTKEKSHTNIDRTLHMAHQSEIQSDEIGFGSFDGETERQMLDLHGSSGDRAQTNSHRSLPQDRHCEGASLPPMQQDDWVCDGQSDNTNPSCPISRCEKVLVSGSKWDWYSVGGHYRGQLLAKPGKDGIEGNPGVFGNKAWRDGGLDSLKVGDIDFARMRATAEIERRSAIDKAILAIQAKNPDLTREAIYDIHAAAARAFPHAKAAWEAEGKSGGSGKRFWDWLKESDNEHAKLVAYSDQRGVFEPLCGYFGGTGLPETEPDIDGWIARAPVLQVFAVLHNGEWKERGEMGWWGVVTDEKDKRSWEEEVSDLLGTLDPESWLTIVDCHI